MPGNPNLEFVRELRKNRQLPAIILVTAYPTLHTAIDSVELPVDAYLIKPFQPEDLQRLVSQLLQLG